MFKIGDRVVMTNSEENGVYSSDIGGLSLDGEVGTVISLHKKGSKLITVSVLPDKKELRCNWAALGPNGLIEREHLYWNMKDLKPCLMKNYKII